MECRRVHGVRNLSVLSGLPEARMLWLTKKLTDGLCQKNPASLQARRESMVESGVGVGETRYTFSEKSTIPTRKDEKVEGEREKRH